MAKKLALAAAGMDALALPIGVGMMTAPASRAQPAGKPSFEVATVKPSAGGDIRSGPGPLPGGRVKARSVTLKMLMAVAYNVREENISGGPNWIATDRWDIEARTEEGSKPPGGWPEWLEPDQPLTLMVQSLLEDRFQLKVRRGTREAPVYELGVAKTGPRMKLSAGQDMGWAWRAAWIDEAKSAGSGISRGMEYRLLEAQWSSSAPARHPIQLTLSGKALLFDPMLR